MQFLSLLSLALVSCSESKFLRDVVEHGTWQVKEAGRVRFRFAQLFILLSLIVLCSRLLSSFFSSFLLVRLEPCRSVNYLSGNVASIQLVALHSRKVSESKSVFGFSFLRFQIVQLFATSSHLCNVLHNLRCANLSQFPSLLHAAQFDGTESQLTHKLSQL